VARSASAAAGLGQGGGGGGGTPSAVKTGSTDGEAGSRGVVIRRGKSQPAAGGSRGGSLRRVSDGGGDEDEDVNDGEDYGENEDGDTLARSKSERKASKGSSRMRRKRNRRRGSRRKFRDGAEQDDKGEVGDDNEEMDRAHEFAGADASASRISDGASNAGTDPASDAGRDTRHDIHGRGDGPPEAGVLRR